MLTITDLKDFVLDGELIIGDKFNLKHGDEKHVKLIIDKTIRSIALLNYKFLNIDLEFTYEYPRLNYLKIDLHCLKISLPENLHVKQLIIII